MEQAITAEWHCCTSSAAAAAAAVVVALVFGEEEEELAPLPLPVSVPVLVGRGGGRVERRAEIRRHAESTMARKAQKGACVRKAHDDDSRERAHAMMALALLRVRVELRAKFGPMPCGGWKK